MGRGVGRGDEARDAGVRAVGRNAAVNPSSVSSRAARNRSAWGNGGSRSRVDQPATTIDSPGAKPRSSVRGRPDVNDAQLGVTQARVAGGGAPLPAAFLRLTDFR